MCIATKKKKNIYVNYSIFLNAKNDLDIFLLRGKYIFYFLVAHEKPYAR